MLELSWSSMAAREAWILSFNIWIVSFHDVLDERYVERSYSKILLYG